MSLVRWMTDRDNPRARAFCRTPGFAEFDGKIVYRVDAGTVCRGESDGRLTQPLAVSDDALRDAPGPC